MDKRKLLITLKNLYEQYLSYAEQVKKEGNKPEFWEGKASGILLAIEVIEGKI